MVLWLSISVIYFFESTTQWSNYLPQRAKVLTQRLHAFLSPRRANVTQILELRALRRVTYQVAYNPTYLVQIQILHQFQDSMVELYIYLNRQGY